MSELESGGAQQPLEPKPLTPEQWHNARNEEFRLEREGGAFLDDQGRFIVPDETQRLIARTYERGGIRANRRVSYDDDTAARRRHFERTTPDGERIRHWDNLLDSEVTGRIDRAYRRAGDAVRGVRLRTPDQRAADRQELLGLLTPNNPSRRPELTGIDPVELDRLLAAPRDRALGRAGIPIATIERLEAQRAAARIYQENLGVTTDVLIEHPELRLGSSVRVQRSMQPGQPPQPEDGWTVVDIRPTGFMRVAGHDLVGDVTVQQLLAWQAE